MEYLAVPVAMIVALVGTMLTAELADIVDDDPGCGCGCLLLGMVGSAVIAYGVGTGMYALLSG